MSSEKPDMDTAEFRESSVKLANESHQSVVQVAKELGNNVNMLHAKIEWLVGVGSAV